MGWEIEHTDQFEAWYLGLPDEDRARIIVAVEKLEEQGPALGRPWADTISGSRHRNMKELRPRGEFLRIFFAFDPRRTCILLIGGDKRDQWATFYTVMIPIADALYDAYLHELHDEGAI